MLLRDLSPTPLVRHGSAGMKETSKKSSRHAILPARHGSFRHGLREGRGGWQAADGCSAFVSSMCTPDIIRNLKFKYASLLKVRRLFVSMRNVDTGRLDVSMSAVNDQFDIAARCFQEKNELTRNLEALQTSMRATRMGELEKENCVLLTEVGRLRQMNELLHKKMIAKQQAADTHVMSLQSKVAELKLDRRRCICIPGVSMQCDEPSTRNPKDTLADLTSRSRTAHVALEHTVCCCKHILRSDIIQADSHTTRAAVEVLEAIARKHSMINDQLCSLINRSSTVGEDQLLNKQSLTRPCKIQAPRNRAGMETRSPTQLTKKHVDDARTAMALLIHDLRNMRTVQFASNSELQQQTRVVGKLVTEFVQRHMELDPAVQRQPRIKAGADACMVTALQVQTRFHTRKDDLVPEDRGHSLDAARNDIDDRGDGAAVSAKQVHNMDCSMQSPAQTPAVPSASGVVRGFFGKASLQARPDSSSLQMDSVLSLDMAAECDMPNIARNDHHAARGAGQSSYASEHSCDVWHEGNSPCPGGNGKGEHKLSEESDLHPAVSECVDNEASSGYPQVEPARSAIERDITQAEGAVLVQEVPAAENKVLETSMYTRTCYDSYGTIASVPADAVCMDAEQHQGQHTLGHPESAQLSNDVAFSSDSSQDVFSEAPVKRDDSATGLGLAPKRERTHSMATTATTDLSGKHLSQELRSTGSRCMGKTSCMLAVTEKSASSARVSSDDSDINSGQSCDSITSCTSGTRTHSSCNSTDSRSNSLGNGCRSASAASSASGHTNSVHQPAQRHMSMDWKADTCVPLHDIRDSEKGKASEDVCGPGELSTQSTFMGSSLASSTAQADEIAAVLDEICDEIEGSASIHDMN